MNYQNKGKNDKSAQTRTLYITLALALAVIAVLVVLTGAWRRASDRAISTDTTEVFVSAPDVQVIAPHTDTATETEADTEEITVESSALSSEAPTAAEVALPEFVSPVQGYLLNSHSGDTPVFSETMNDYRPHIGVDLYGSVGDDVFAAAAGTVTDIWEDPMSGNCLRIAHDGGAETVYRNLDPLNPDGIAVGSVISAGEVIGSIGETSLLEVAEEPHLHFELMIDGVSVDPAHYISFNMADTEYEG